MILLFDLSMLGATRRKADAAFARGALRKL